MRPARADFGEQNRSRPRSSRGQIAVELLGMSVIIFISIMMLWQALLAGYTILLASRAADQSAREAAAHLNVVADSQARARGEDAGRQGLPTAWRNHADVTVGVQGNEQARANVRVRIPLVVPGWTTIPMSVTASSAARP